MSKWWDQSWNPLIGCSHASPGCANCYAEKLAGTRLRHLPPYRMATTNGKWNGNIVQQDNKLGDPTHWRKPRRIFVNDMGDTFHPHVPFEYIAAMYGVMAACPQHVFILLTKRPDRMLKFYEWLVDESRMAQCPIPLLCGVNAQNHGVDVDAMGLPDVWPLRNVWVGTTCEDQDRADKRIPDLVQVPAAVRFLSLEPLLGPIELKRDEYGHETGGPQGWVQDRWVDWLIPGGESGPRARECRREWLESIARQGEDDGIAVYMKQMGSAYIDEKNWVAGRFAKVPKEYGRTVRRLKDVAGRNMDEWPNSLRVRQYPEAT